jgi:hypothetical protein
VLTQGVGQRTHTERTSTANIALAGTVWLSSIERAHPCNESTDGNSGHGSGPIWKRHDSATIVSKRDGDR